MKNLKRALSMALASVMLLGMMVVGAGAAEFNDADKIENVDAVNTLVALGIIAGKDTGDFDPEGIVTRAEMAKMICVALNSGKDPALKGGTSYPDTKTHWAGGYIDYCTNLKIVSGDTAGNFNPDKTVTGTEAAKMILIALGFNAENEKFVNDAAWATNINVRASQKGLYEDVPGLPDAGLTRDNAAQMIWNGLQADMVRYEYDLGTENGNLTSIAILEDISPAKTILSEKFKMDTTYGYMTGVGYDDTKKEYTYFLDNGTTFGVPTTDVIASDDLAASSLKSEKDYSSLFGMKVKTLTKTSSNKTTVYGIYATDSEVLYEGVGDDLPSITATADSVKLDSTTYKLTQTADKVKVFPYNQATVGNLNDGLDTELAFQLVDNTGDGKADVVITYPVSVVKVSFVGKDSITAGNISYKFDDCDIYEGVKKDDYVVITAAENTATETPVIVKAETVTGTIGATRSGEVRVDGTWYTDATDKAGDTYTISDEFELVVVNGFVFHSKAITSSTNVDNAVYVLAADPIGEGTKAGTQTVQLLFADGSKKVVTADKVDAKTPETLAEIAADNKVTKDQLYTYGIDKDGNYELSRIDADDFDDTLEAADGAHGIKVDDGKATVNNAGTTRFADDAVIFVSVTKDGKTKIDVISGKTINSWKTDYTTTTAASVTTANAQKDQNILYADTTSGFLYAKLGVLVLSGEIGSVPGAGGTASYGWITATPSVVKDGDDYFVELTIWNGEDTVTVLADKSGTNSFDLTAEKYTKGTPISYDDLGGNEIENVDSLKAKADAVTGYNDGKEILFETAGDAEIDDDTVILYVNTADNEGVEGGSIVVAQKTVLDTYVKNVYADVDDGVVKYIFVDTANNLDQNDDADIIADNTVFTAIDLDAKTCTVANGKDVADVIAAAKAMDGVADADVVKSVSDSEASTSLATGNVLRIVAEDGSYHSFVITLATL